MVRTKKEWESRRVLQETENCQDVIGRILKGIQTPKKAKENFLSNWVLGTYPGNYINQSISRVLG